MYSIEERFDNTLDMLSYVISSMKDVGMVDDDVNDFLKNSTNDNNAHLVDVCEKQIQLCNETLESNTEWFDDNWRDYYYNKYNNPYSCIESCDDYDDDYEGYSCIRNKNNIWDDDNVVDDVEDNEDAYEGFSSCKRHVYSSYEDTDDADYQCDCYYNSLWDDYTKSYDEK